MIEMASAGRHRAIQRERCAANRRHFESSRSTAMPTLVRTLRSSFLRFEWHASAETIYGWWSVPLLLRVSPAVARALDHALRAMPSAERTRRTCPPRLMAATLRPSRDGTTSLFEKMAAVAGNARQQGRVRKTLRAAP
jgi:hypothetical protein